MKHHSMLALSAALLLSLTACAGTASAPAQTEAQIASGPVAVFPLEDDCALVMDLLSDGDLAQFSEQTAPGSAAGEEQARQFINCRANLRILTEDGAVLPVEWDMFSVPMEDVRGEGQEAVFYRVAAGDGVLAIPQEDPGTNTGSRFYAWTDAGIWKIDPEQGTGSKVTSDFYQGMHYTALAEDADACHHLFWIGNPMVSPDGRYVVYRSNRSAPKDYGDCLWALDGTSGRELQLTSDAHVYRVPEGFVGPTEVLVANLSGDTPTAYSVVDVATGAEMSLQMPTLPNVSICATSPAGYAALGYYDDAACGTAIVQIQGKDVTTVQDFPGIYGTIHFSPSGAWAGISYNLDLSRPDSELLLFDLCSEAERYLSDDAASLMDHPGSASISDFAWISDNALLVTTESTEGGRAETTDLWQLDGWR